MLLLNSASISLTLFNAAPRTSLSCSIRSVAASVVAACESGRLDEMWVKSHRSCTSVSLVLCDLLCYFCGWCLGLQLPVFFLCSRASLAEWFKASDLSSAHVSGVGSIPTGRKQ